MIVNGDALNLPIASGTCQCIVTSPPYYGLRDYGVNGQIGLEQSPEEYVAKLVAVFRECWRVLREDGVMWVNLGSSFVSGVIESQEYILRDDLTAEELEYVYSELAEHFKTQSKAV